MNAICLSGNEIVEKVQARQLSSLGLEVDSEHADECLASYLRSGWTLIESRPISGGWFLKLVKPWRDRFKVAPIEGPKTLLETVEAS